MEGKDLEQVVRLATKCAFALYKELLADNPQYTTRRVARKKYKFLLYEWEQRGLIKPIRTENGKHEVFPTHRLVELYEIYTTGQ